MQVTTQQPGLDGEQTKTEQTLTGGWILRLLYAPSLGQPATSVGSTRAISGGLAIAIDNINRVTESQVPVSFTADNWGLQVVNIDDIMAELIGDGLVRVTHRHSRRVKGYTLTESGISVAARLYDSLGSRKREVLEWTRTQHMSQGTSRVLLFVQHQELDTPESRINLTA